MATYAGVTFTPLRDNAWPDRWHRPANVTRRHIPYANKDDVQSAGLSNDTVTLTALLTADADIATLYAAVGVTKRTLNVWSTNYGNTMLTGMSKPRRHVVDEAWLVDLTFEREGA